MKLSVVIPCRNEITHIEECLTAIFASEGISNFDTNVFVVDGQSDDGTRALIQKLATLNPKLHLLDNPSLTTPNAFNIGINQRDFDYLLIVGARHILSNNYISKCIEVLKSNENIWCVGGSLINQYTNSESQIISKAMSSSFGMGLGNFRTLSKSAYTDTVTSPMYPKKVFDTIGLFDAQLTRNQDDDFNFRVLKAGGKIWFEADIELKYYVRNTFKQVSKQFFQYGYWKVYVNKKHKTITTIRQMAPPLFVFYLLLSPFIFLLPFGFFWILLLPNVFYLILLLFFSIKYADHSTTNFLGLIRSFVTLHLSYGSGYIRGILEFLILRKSPSIKQQVLTR
jgi:glycosyltransferase involved in cell wall biosynthesis